MNFLIFVPVSFLSLLMCALGGSGWKNWLCSTLFALDNASESDCSASGSRLVCVEILQMSYNLFFNYASCIFRIFGDFDFIIFDSSMALSLI